MVRIVRSLVAVGLLAALATVGSAGPASAGFPNTQLSLTKIVNGQELAPTGAEWVVDIPCIAQPTQTFNLGDLGPRMFPVNPSNPCNVVETQPAGANTVAYTCAVAPQNPAGVGTLTVSSCTASDQGVAIEFNQGGTEDTIVTITVTNTYTPAPPPAPAVPAPAGVVAAQPSFTG